MCTTLAVGSPEYRVLQTAIELISAQSVPLYDACHPNTLSVTELLNTHSVQARKTIAPAFDRDIRCGHLAIKLNNETYIVTRVDGDDSDRYVVPIKSYGRREVDDENHVPIVSVDVEVEDINRLHTLQNSIENELKWTVQAKGVLIYDELYCC
jgi:hypothetical protein